MILLDQKRIARTSKRMAYQILEEAGDSPIHLVGLNERGYSLASLIHSFLNSSETKEVTLQQMEADEVTPFKLDPAPEDQAVLIFVDDVIFSGSTLQKAMDRIPDYKPFKKILVAVLADRGHRKFPIQAAIVGSHIPTKLNEHLEMKLENSEPYSVELLKPASL